MFLLFLFAKPVHNFSQNKSLITSIELGSTLFNTKVIETALLIGFVDHETKDTFEVGYVYRHILAHTIGHKKSYHGIRGPGQVQILGDFGFYGTYDIISGQRWLYDDLAGNGLAVRKKINGEGTLGLFYVPKALLINFYLGFSPSHYDPEKIKIGGTPHKSSSISLKIKYTLNFKETRK